MIGKNNDQNLPPINLSNTDKPAANKKSTRKTESILARMPKVRTTTGQSKLGLFDRLRNLSKKDFAYLAAASGVVITLPFAEHYMVKPEATPRIDTFSTASRGRSAGAGEVFEPGNGAFAPGGAPGGSSDVVTPLSARDPSSLIIGPGDGQQAQVLPMQQTPPPSTPAPVKDSPITSAVRAGASSANNTAAGPFIPSSKLQAHIRGLESVSGGGKASAGELWGGKVLQAAGKVPNSAAMSNSPAPSIMRGYAGTSRSRTSAGSNSAMEDLKRGASNAADFLNGRNAVQSLDRAADASVYAGGTNTGGGPGGGPGEGQGYKGGGVNNISGAAQRSAGKESLEAELARTKAMAELQRQIKWQDYLKLELPKMIIDTMAKAIMEPIGKAIGSKVSDALSGPPSAPLYYTCICVTEKCGPVGSVAVSVPYNKDKDYAEYTKPEGRSCSVGKKVDSSTSASNPTGGTNSTGGPATVPGSTAKKTGIAKYDEKFASGARAGDAKSLDAFTRAQKAITDSCATPEACAAAKGELKKYFEPSNVSELAGQYASALKEHQAILEQGYLEDDVNQVAQNAAAVSFNTPIDTVQSVFDDGEIVKYIKDCGQANPVASKEICSAVNALPASARDYATIQGNIETAKKAYQDGTATQSSIASAAARFSGGKEVSRQLLAQAEEKLTSEAPSALDSCTDANSCLAALNLLGQPSALGETTVASAYPLRKGDFRCAVESSSVFSLMKRARGTMDDFKTEAGLKTYPAVSGDYSEYSGVALYAVMKQNYETLYGNAETYNKVQMPALSQAAAAYTKLKEEIKKVTDKAKEAEKQNAALKQDQEALAQQQAKLAAEQRRQAEEQRRQAAEQKRQAQELSAQRRKYNSLSVQQKQVYCQQNAGNALISVQICNNR